MPKYLFVGSYTQSGVVGVLKEGGSGRRVAVDNLVRGLGGTLESVYFALGTDDFFVVADLPGPVEAASVSLIVAASGAAQGRMVALLTPEQIDQATRLSVPYRPPGA